MGSPLPRVAAVALLALSLHSADGKKKRRKKAAPVVECGGKEPTTDGFEVRVLESVDADVCDRRSRVGDTLTVKFASRYFDTCETFAENKAEEFVLGDERVLTGWNWGLQGMCEGEKRALYLTSHALLTPDSATRRASASADVRTKSRAVVMDVELQEIAGRRFR